VELVWILATGATESIPSRLSPADPVATDARAAPKDLAAVTEAVHLTDTDRTTRSDSTASPGGSGSAAFDPFSAQIPDDPYPMYRELRDHAPVYRNDARDFWALSRFDDVQWASRDWHALTNADGVEQDRWGKLLRVSSFIGEDPPRHDQLRSILRKHFVPKQMHLLEATVEGITAALLRDAIDDRHADLAADFGWPLGVSVVCELLGLPEVDRSQMQQWLDQMLWRNPGDTEVPSVAIDTAKTVRDYFASVIASRRSQTDRDDVLSTLISAERAGDLSRDELLDMCGLLFVAATDTVASAVSNAVILLGTHRDQRGVLRGDPDLLPAAIEEVVRYEAPVQFLARKTTRPVTLHGVTMPAGEWVLLLHAAANRDERRFDDAESFDITRKPMRHLGFGDGIHFCLGAPLARLQARAALRSILDTIPEYEVQSVQRYPSYNARGVSNLVVAW
jgi:cytochrome P450